MQIRNKFHLVEAHDQHVAAIRVLVNTAYKELSDQGLNYTATYQDEETTRERMKKGSTFILVDGEEVIATILYFSQNYLTSRKTAYLGQLAVTPKYKKQGLGSILMDHCEQLAQQENYDGIQLDTAQPATHLVNWYLKRGYRIVGSTHWEGKTYDSYIFEKSFK